VGNYSNLIAQAQYPEGNLVFRSHTERNCIFRQSLYRHMKFHEGKRPFECDICGMAFVLRHNLKEHYVRHDKQQKIKCARCSLVMASKEAATEHRKQCAGVQNLAEGEDITEITLEPIEPEISDEEEECEINETIVDVDVLEQ